MEPVLTARPAPGTRAIPLVCDSPHSGTHYPADFGHAIERQALRRCEDTHVERLWQAVPDHGGTLIAATFPRSYIDCNRDEADIDVTLLDGAWPHAARPSRQCRELGNGLAWRRTPDGREIYDRRLSPAELAQRIARCFQPYRAALRRALQEAQDTWGGSWHLNLHSMPSNAYERLGLGGHGKVLADVVLGDRGGTTCDAAFRDTVRAAFEDEGLRVAVNDPYEGLELVRLAGEPARERHSLQVEINRALYLDEATREPTARFAPLQAAIDRVLVRVADHVTRQGNALRNRQGAQLGRS